jgi:alpha-L-fucosidase
MKRIPILFLTAFTALIVIAREPQTDMGIRQQDDATMQWFSDAKFGMFIHWGLYAVPAKGEWYMDQAAIPAETYRKYAFDQGDGVFFDANDFDPAAWAQLAKDAGMKYMCLTARYHDGFALFDSQFTNAFTSVQTLHRDLFVEYVRACRAAGLRVGMYYSPINWRYPGYFDVTGTNCAKNK